MEGNIISDDRKLPNTFNTFKVQGDENIHKMNSNNPDPILNSTERHQMPASTLATLSKVYEKCTTEVMPILIHFFQFISLVSDKVTVGNQLLVMIKSGETVLITLVLAPILNAIILSAAMKKKNVLEIKLDSRLSFESHVSSLCRYLVKSYKLHSYGPW